MRLSWQLPAAGRPQLHRLWTAQTPCQLPDAISGWQLTPADIQAGAAATAAGPAIAASVIRRRLRNVSLTSMTALDCPYGWDDLVVPEHVEASLHRLRTQVLLSRQVLEDWEFRRLCPATAGVTALFAGPPGTGKTMAAQVLAGKLGLPMFRVDLSQVVNKYIGETEKNLRRLFDSVEESNALLFFDEADALFGQRTQVRNAHDRWANIEIDYLLQRLDIVSRRRGPGDEPQERPRPRLPAPAAGHRRLPGPGTGRAAAALAAGAAVTHLGRRAGHLRAGPSLARSAPRADRRRDQVGRAVRGVRRPPLRRADRHPARAGRVPAGTGQTRLPAAGRTPGGSPVSGPPSVRIDRLTLSAGTMTEAQGRRLAELVGQELLRLPASAPAWTEQADVSVTDPASRTLEATARAVVAAIEAVLRADGAS